MADRHDTLARGIDLALATDELAKRAASVMADMNITSLEAS